MIIRKATKKDVNVIANIIKTEFNKPPFKDDWTDKTAKIAVNNYFIAGHPFVAIIGDKIVGVLVLIEDPYAKGLYIVVDELVVNSKFQKKGIGKALIEFAEDYAKRKKAYIIYLYTHKNSYAFNFYKKMKYKPSRNLVAMGKKL
jgi:aminoglycoside 6'-N-acetyltransferase I